MSNIHVPIDTSEVASVIPAGEDIVYSTICYVKERGGVGPTAYKKKYSSHVVLTANGIAFEIKRKLSKKYLYSPYIDRRFRVVLKGVNGFHLGGGTSYSFRLKYRKEFEDKQEFNERNHNFFKTMAPIYINAVEKNIEESPPGRATEKKKKHIQKLKKKL
jgi:hypothetical protein